MKRKRLILTVASTSLALGLIGVSIANENGAKKVAASAGDTYQLVTSTSDLVAGKKYIIGSAKETSSVFMKTTSNTNNRPQTTAITVSADSKVTLTAEVLTLELGGTTGAWTFKTTNYGGANQGFFDTTSSDKNYLTVNSSTSNYQAFTISFSSDAAVITCTGKAKRNILMYNSSSSLFSCYTSGMAAVYLYKDVTPVVEFGTLSTIAVNTSGSTVTTKYLAGSKFSSTGITAVATSTTSVTNDLVSSDLKFFIGATDISAGYNFASTDIGSVTITAKYTLDSVTAQDTFSVTVQDLDHIVLDTSSATLAFNKGETFSGVGVTGTAYGDATEANAGTKNITNANFSFYKDSSKTSSLTDYVFAPSDAGTFAVYAFYKLSTTETEKYASYNLTITADASYALTFDASNTFPSTSSPADIGTDGYCKTMDFSGQRFTLSVLGTDSLKTRVMTATTSGQQVGTSSNAATSIVLKTGIFSTSLSERKITKVVITVAGASKDTSAGTITSSFVGVDPQTYSSNTETTMTFTPSEGVFGSVSFTFSNIAKGVFIKNVKIFADVDTTDTGKAYGFAHDVEIADSCDTTKYSALANTYAALSDTAKATANAITIDDLADKTTTSDGIVGRCTVSQKMAAMKTRAEAGSNVSLTFGEKNDTESLMIITIGSALLLISGLAIVVIKKKHA